MGGTGLPIALLTFYKNKLSLITCIKTPSRPDFPFILPSSRLVLIGLEMCSDAQYEEALSKYWLK
jgi:hypothetical protein